MSETIRSRVSRIISMGFSAIVGAVEGLSPEGVMEEAIREVDEAADEVRAELGKVLASRHLAGKRLAEKTNAYEELEKKIAVAVGEGRDDLAEAGIAHQLDVEAQLPILRSAADDLGKREAELSSYIAALGAKKREMREELAKYRSSLAQAGPAAQAAAGSAADASDPAKKVSKASSAFERVMAKQTGLPGTGGVSPSDHAKLLELDKLNRENRIKERLLAFKAGQKP